MPRHFEAPAQNYRNVDEFKESAIKTLNKLFGQRRPLNTFDFAERKGDDGVIYLTCVAYHQGEKMPKEQFAGEPVSDEAKAAEEKARLEQEARAKAGELIANATEGALKFAAANNVDLLKVVGTGNNGRVTQPDVALYLKTKAPEKDTANGTDGQQQ